MKNFVFASKCEPLIQAITHDATGDNLPSKASMDWRAQTNCNATAMDDLSAAARNTIRRHGFVLLAIDHPPRRTYSDGWRLLASSGDPSEV
jgi:hypothetical protein